MKYNQMRIIGRQRYPFEVILMVIALNGFGIIMSGCEKEKGFPVINATNNGQTMSSNNQSIPYLALGDSYTIGQSVAETDRFPEILVYKLNALGHSVQKPQIIATTGWTTQNLLAAISNIDPPKNFRFVTLLIGVNNQYQQHDTIGYRDQFKACMAKAVELVSGNKKQVFILSIPDYGVTPFGQSQNPALIATQIDQYNAINRELAAAAGISYTDITAISRQALTDQSLTATDGLHPSGKQYRLWMELLSPKIAELLK